MKRMLFLSMILLATTLNLGAQGKAGKGGSPRQTTGAAHGNAQAGPHKSTDADKGKDRAEEVGKGKKKGLKKQDQKKNDKK